MKPAWDKLGNEYKNSKSVIIGDVDCTVEKTLCQKYEVRGYPTIKYYTGSTAPTGDDYKGGRDYDALSLWAKENLGPTCGAENLDLCSDEQKAVLEAKMKLTTAELDAEIDAAEAEIKAAESELEELLKSLQSQYEAGQKKKEDANARLSPVLGLLRSVKRAAPGGKSEL